MQIVPVTLYVASEPLDRGKSSKQCFILGSDNNYYVQQTANSKFHPQTELPENFDLDKFELAKPKDRSTSFIQALKSVPTSRDFWIHALTPTVETCEWLEFEGHEGKLFPSFLNVYMTREGEYLGCKSEMVYDDTIKSFIPTNPPQSIISLGFNAKGGHFQPTKLSSTKPVSETYTVIKSELLKILNLNSGESVYVKSKFSLDMVRTISMSLGIELRFTNSRRSGSFGVGIRLARA